MTAELDTPEGERLDVLVTLVEAYEPLQSARANIACAPSPNPGQESPMTPAHALVSSLAKQLLDRVDKALYRAKHEGRNRVCADPT